jgi:hypothetical protein
MQKPTPGLRPPLRRLNRVLNDIHAYLDEQWFHPRYKSYFDAAVLTLLSKSLALARSTACLVQNGFDEEAFASSRMELTQRLTRRKMRKERAHEIFSFHANQRAPVTTVLLSSNT